MSILVTILIGLGTLLVGGLAGWFVKQIKTDATQTAELEHLKTKIEGLSATKQAATDPNGQTPHQQLMHQTRTTRSVVTSMAEEMHTMQTLLSEWDKHYWPKVIKALEASAGASDGAAQVTESLISLIKSGVIGTGKSGEPSGSSD